LIPFDEHDTSLRQQALGSNVFLGEEPPPDQVEHLGCAAGDLEINRARRSRRLRVDLLCARNRSEMEMIPHDDVADQLSAMVFDGSFESVD
jgi:hypothetical protein